MFAQTQDLPPTLVPAVDVDLHTHAEWRVNTRMQFDGSGRLLILYRDNAKLSRSGNWHLIRLTGPKTPEPIREEITFSINQEPADPDRSRRWDSFGTDLLLSPDGGHAYAIFDGAIVTAKDGPRPITGGRNVNIGHFSSAISFDLKTFRLLSSADITHDPPNSTAHQIDADGNLLLLCSADTDWMIAVLDAFLREVRTVSISMVTVHKMQRYSCQFRPDIKIECPTFDGGDLLLSQQSSIQLPHSTCKMSHRSGVLGFGKDEILNGGLIKSDRLCIRGESGQEQLISPDLLPRCHQGWQAEAISLDRRSLLISCIEENNFLDMFFYLSKASLQIIDATTLAQRAIIPLPTRSRWSQAIFHGSGTTTVAVLVDSGRLRLFSIAD